MQTLIINKRHEMPKRKRLLWDAFTVLLWMGWIYLWKPVIIVLYKIIMLDAPVEELSDVIYEQVNAIPFEEAIFMLIATPVILFILSRLNRHQAPSEHLVYSRDQYSEYFKLEDEQLTSCIESQLVTVYHDEYGHIVRLENTIGKVS